MLQMGAKQGFGPERGETRSRREADLFLVRFLFRLDHRELRDPRHLMQKGVISFRKPRSVFGTRTLECTPVLILLPVRHVVDDDQAVARVSSMLFALVLAHIAVTTRFLRADESRVEVRIHVAASRALVFATMFARFFDRVAHEAPILRCLGFV